MLDSIGASFLMNPATTQQLTTATLPSHPSGTIQTVKIGGGQAQVGFDLHFQFYLISFNFFG